MWGSHHIRVNHILTDNSLYDVLRGKIKVHIDKMSVINVYENLPNQITNCNW